VLVSRGVLGAAILIVVDQPLIHQVFRTDGVDRLVDRLGQIEIASRSGQFALKAAMNRRLERVEWSTVLPLVSSHSVALTKAIIRSLSLSHRSLDLVNQSWRALECASR